MSIDLVDDLGRLFAEQWRMWLPLACGFLALCATAIGHRSARLGIGTVAGLLALVLGWSWWIRASAPGHRLEGFLFAVFAAGAIAAAFGMVVQNNPVYAALCFALVILSTCGLFLLQAAPFLAAATIIVYAGAIIVTFLFVIMLAQQSGRALYDQRLRLPAVAGLAGCFLLGAILVALQSTYGSAGPLENDRGKVSAVRSGTVPVLPILQNRRSPLSEPGPLPADAATLTPNQPEALATASTRPAVSGVVVLGRSLFGDYLWASELAGTLLLVTTIGAIAIVNRPKGATAV